MKALRIAFLLLFVWTNVFAAPTGKLLVVNQAKRNSESFYEPSYRRTEIIVFRILHQLGVDIVRIDPALMKAEWGKTGTIGWGWGKTVADSCTRCESVDAALWIRSNFGGAMATGWSRPDSLFNFKKITDAPSGLTIPNMILQDDVDAEHFMQATCCTSGVNTISSSNTYNYGIQRPVGSLSGWFTAGLFQKSFYRKNGTTPAGGFRPMLVTNQPARYVYGPTINCAWCDSIPGANAAAGDDSLIMFSIPYYNVSGSKPLFYAYIDGNGSQGDSISNLGGSGDGISGPAEVDPTVILYALAALDSSTGNKLFDYSKLPIKIGLVIEAANVYGDNRAGPGIPPQDSSVLIATIDSLASLNASGGVKLFPTVAINCAGVSGAGDSLNGTGAYNKGWIDRWRSIGGTKFTPQSWAGILNTAYRRAAAGVGDVYGYADARTFVGDFDQTAGTADTSVAQLLKWSKRLLIQAGIDPNEMSKTAVAPLLDWAPVNHNTVASRDSMFYAMRLAGYTTVISDVNLPQSEPSRAYDGTRAASATYRGVSNGFMGYTAKEGIYRDAGGGYFKVLASNGHEIVGGTQQNVPDDTSNVQTWYDPLLQTMWRTVGGVLTPNDKWNTDAGYNGTDFSFGTGDYYGYLKDQLIAHTLWYPNNDGDRAFTAPGHILRLTTADLSGEAGGGARGAPARNGWWIIKSLKNWMDAVNNAAGRTVITFDYPENITP